MREMRRICDVPKEQLEAEMRQFAQRRWVVKAARSFLRSVGMEIKKDGTVVYLQNFLK
mgnify:CR=1 FL=1